MSEAYIFLTLQNATLFLSDMILATGNRKAENTEAEHEEAHFSRSSKPRSIHEMRKPCHLCSSLSTCCNS